MLRDPSIPVILADALGKGHDIYRACPQVAPLNDGMAAFDGDRLFDDLVFPSAQSNGAPARYDGGFDPGMDTAFVDSLLASLQVKKQQVSKVTEPICCTGAPGCLARVP